jgi:hypothetical protein
MSWGQKAGLVGLVLALAGCAPTVVRDTMATAAPPPVVLPTQTGLEAVMGRSASVITGRLGAPALDIREGDARKLQFAGPVCVLDAYLYPPAARGGEPIVTYVDARRLDGGDFDRASCLAALTAQKQVR